MRTRAWIPVIALACLAAAVLAVVARRRATPAAAEPAPAATSDRVEEPRPVTMTEAAVEPQPTEDVPRSDLADAAVREGRRAGAAPFDLLAELEAARELGIVGDAGLVGFLAAAYLQRRELHRALGLLQRSHSQDVDLWRRLAYSFENVGDVAGQREALRAALALEPRSASLLADLGRIDPDLALAELTRQLAADPPPGDDGLRRAMAGLLLRNGREAEARPLIDGLLSQDPAERETLWLLFELQPARAIDHVERLMASSAGAAEPRRMLVSFLAASGDAEQAEALLDRLESEGQSIGTEEWAIIAESWRDAEDTARCVAALLRALDREHGDPDEWAEDLAELAPAQLLLALERRVASDEAGNDAYWGSLADAYWADGRQADARAAWEQAGALDPDDDEWQGRLRALELWRDPYE